MDDRTRAYLRGRFRDYYRTAALSLPPAAERREWGYIPWTDGGTTMVRHRALFQLGDLPAFLSRQRPRHVYFSAGRYREPGAGSMGEKGWEGSDLVFDLDADHLPAVDPEEDSYASMLAACKDALWRLLSLLEDDLGFSDLAVVFSGSRGYHVHVRDESVRGLSREARREVVDYVRGNGVELESLVRTETVAGDFGRATPAERRSLPTAGGWGGRVHERLVSLLAELRELPEEEALSRLRGYEGIGEDRARMVLGAAADSADAIDAGTVDVNQGLLRLARHVAAETVAAESAAIDEPVTTDIHRLIRLPGSLHGGTGLRVTPIDRADLDGFDPLVDAVPDTWDEEPIRVRLEEGPPVTLAGETFRVEAGERSLPEHAALFLMARDRAEKVQ